MQKKKFEFPKLDGFEHKGKKWLRTEFATIPFQNEEENDSKIHRLKEVA